MKTICRKLNNKGFAPQHAAEVGVYHPETSNIYDYLVDGTRCTLVEPRTVTGVVGELCDAIEPLLPRF